MISADTEIRNAGEVMSPALIPMTEKITMDGNSPIRVPARYRLKDALPAPKYILTRSPGRIPSRRIITEDDSGCFCGISFRTDSFGCFKVREFKNPAPAFLPMKYGTLAIIAEPAILRNTAAGSENKIPLAAYRILP